MINISLPNTNLYLEGAGHDKNGHKIVKLGIGSLNRNFSIQLNGQLPHSNHILTSLRTKKDMQTISQEELTLMGKEIAQYIEKFGSPLQREKLRIYNS